MESFKTKTYEPKYTCKEYKYKLLTTVQNWQWHDLTPSTSPASHWDPVPLLLTHCSPATWNHFLFPPQAAHVFFYLEWSSPLILFTEITSVVFSVVKKWKLKPAGSHIRNTLKTPKQGCFVLTCMVKEANKNPNSLHLPPLCLVSRIFPQVSSTHVQPDNIQMQKRLPLPCKEWANHAQKLTGRLLLYLSQNGNMCPNQSHVVT